MSLAVDYLIVGSGLTGSVIARMLKDAGREVLVVERRFHVGGNVHDYTHSSGIRIHTYGPHFFRTSSKRIWRFVNRFSSFFKYEAIVKSYVDGCYENWPIAAEYIQRTVGEKWEPEFRGTPANFEEASLAMMPRLIYERFVKGYTEKQWGVPAHTLSADLAKRFVVRKDNDPRLVQHKYQGIPEDGYATFMANILSGVNLMLNFDYLKNREAIELRKMLIFTGPIDEFFSFDLGRLHYRGQQREHIYLAGVDQYQPYSQVNYPSADKDSQIRTIEWKHMMPPNQIKAVQGTVITKETAITPTDPDRYEYPFPDGGNQQLYHRYKVRAESIPNLLICGRLGEYRYYDMDQAIERAMFLAGQILKSPL